MAPMQDEWGPLIPPTQEAAPAQDEWGPLIPPAKPIAQRKPSFLDKMSAAFPQLGMARGLLDVTKQTPEFERVAGNLPTGAIEEAGGVGPYLTHMFSKKNLGEAGANLVKAAKELPAGLLNMGKELADVGPKVMARITGLNAPGVPPPTGEAPAEPADMLEGLRQDLAPVKNAIMFPSELVVDWIRDPAKAIRERGMDTVLMTLGSVVGKSIHKFAKQWKAGYLSDEGLANAVAETIDELNRSKADYNATTSLVHTGSKIGEPPTNIKVGPGGVAVPVTEPVSRSLAQAGLDAQASRLAKTTEQGPIVTPRDLPSTVIGGEAVGPTTAVEAGLRAYAKRNPDAYNTALRVGGEIQVAGKRMRWDREANKWVDAEPQIKELWAGVKPGEQDRLRMAISGMISKGQGKSIPSELLNKYPDLKAMVGGAAPSAVPVVPNVLPRQGVQYYKPGAKATMPPVIEPTTGAKIIRSATDAPDYGRAYVVAPKAGEQLIPEKTNAQGRVTLWKHEADAVRNIKDRHIGVKETSIYWMEREPILRDGLWHPQKAAEATRGKMMKEAVVDTVSWKKTAPNQERIGAYLISQQKGGPETLKLMGMESAPTLTPQEMSVVTAMRAKYDAWLSRINEARAVYGNDPITGVDSYAPMLRDPKMLAELGIDIVKEPNVDMLKAHLSAPPLKYLQKRVGSILPAELRAYDIYRNYAVQTSKYVTEAPVISKARAISGVLKESGNAEAVRGKLTLWADHLSGQVAPDFIHSPLYRRTVNMLNRNISRAALDLNIRSASIQPTSLVGSYTYLGNKYMVEGLWDNVHPGKRAFAKTHSNVLSTRNFDVNVTDITTPITRGGKIRRGVSKAVAKVSDIAITPLKLGDYESAQATWLGAQRRGVAPTKKGGFGMTPEESYRYADEIVVKTQGSGHPSDIAEIQRSTTGKILTVFQTFTINNWNMLKDIFGGGLARPTKTRVGQIARLLMAVEATNFIFEDALGVRSPFPAPEHAVIRGIKEHKGAGEIALEAAKELTEVYPPFGGTIRYADRWRSPLPAVFQVSWDSYLRAQEILKKAKVNERDFENLGKLLGVPGASQGRKIWAAVKNGKSLKEAIFGAKEPSKKKSGSSWSKGW